MSLIGFYPLSLWQCMCVWMCWWVCVGTGYDRESRKGAIVCIWAVRLSLWLTNNGNWPGLGAPGRGYGLLSPMARTRRTCRVGAAPTALSGLLLLLLLPLLRLPQPSAGALNFPKCWPNYEEEGNQDPATSIQDPGCQHSWACDIEYWVFMRFRFGVLTLAPLWSWKIEHLAPTLWILKQFYACHFEFWMACDPRFTPFPPIPLAVLLYCGLALWWFGFSWVTFGPTLVQCSLLVESSESFSAVNMVNTQRHLWIINHWGRQLPKFEQFIITTQDSPSLISYTRMLSKIVNIIPMAQDSFLQFMG